MEKTIGQLKQFFLEELAFASFELRWVADGYPIFYKAPDDNGELFLCYDSCIKNNNSRTLDKTYM